MDSPNQPNGTSPFLNIPSLPERLSPQPAASCSVKRTRSASPARAAPDKMPQWTESRDDAYTILSKIGRPVFRGGHAVHGNVPSWNAATLLNPKTHPPSTAMPQPDRSRTNQQWLADASPQLTFQFSTPSGDQMPAASGPAAPSGLPSTSSVQTAVSVNGAGSMIERNFNLQDRSMVPQPKRRKTEHEDDAKSGFHSGSRGIMGLHIHENQPGMASTAPTQPGNTVDLTNGGDEDRDVVVVEKPLDEEVCFGMLEGAQVRCQRVPFPKPNAQALGGPHYWPLVKIVLRRKFGDKTNAIQVYDHTRQVFGFIDAKSSAGLAPLLDKADLHLRTDARIPSRRKAEGEVPGLAISTSFKIELSLYGPVKYARGVARHLASKGLFLIKPLRVEPGKRLVSLMSVRPAETTVAPSPRPTAGQHYASSFSAPISRTVEEIRSEVMGVFDNMTKSEDLPELEPDARITTEMLQHQKQALYFMTNREKPLSEHANTKLVASIWQQKMGRGQQTIYYNIVTGQMERQPPPETLGGILADMMGLGKTLSILSLVSSTLTEAESWSRLEPVQPTAPPEKKKPNSSRNFEAPAPEPLALTRLTKNGKGTLLVCPLSTVANWEEQIKQHLKKDSLTYHVYHGPNRLRDPELLSQMDLVITTYGSVASELTQRNKGKNGKYPLEEIGWFRVVLDEAHMIREQSTLQFKAICRLQANRRWAVTGTPVQNRLDDLGALLAFLRLKPFDDRGKFVHYIVSPFKACDPEILPKLRVLVDTITLRRKKDRINLPGRLEQIVRLDFSPEERKLYNMFEQNAKERVSALTGQRERMLGGKTYIHILQSILRLRLICAHGKDLLNEEDLRVMHGTTAESAIALDSDDEDDRPALSEDKAYQMYDLMTETDNDSCIYCKRKLGATEDADIVESEQKEDLLGYMTPCFHLYCPGCVQNFRDEINEVSHSSGGSGTCPICNQRVQFFCVELRHTRADQEHEGHANAKIIAAKGGKVIRAESYSGPHTKTLALLQELLQSKAESEKMSDEPPIKSVVFSGWTSHLDLIELALDNHDIKYCRLDGKMTRNARSQAMDAFRDDPSVHVILVSIMAGGLGLNLTAGSNVYVMEPQYNPAAEAQAVDRVHRLGQKRDVRIVRYIIRDSWEESMLELQNKKIQLANLSMDRTKGVDRAEAARQRLMDLRSLFR